MRDEGFLRYRDTWPAYALVIFCATLALWLSGLLR